MNPFVTVIVFVVALSSGAVWAQEPDNPDGPSSTETQLSPSPPPSPSTPEPASEPASDAATPTVTHEKEAQLLAEALKNLDREPNLDTLIHAALKQADADVDSVRSWRRRVRLSPMLPTMKVSVGVDLERDESLDRTQDDPDSWGADTDRDFGMQITAQWDLDKLVFHPDELKIYNALADRAERREAIITMIIAYWFERRQLQLIQAVRPSDNVTEQIRQTLRMKELGACIDALTGNLLARNLYRSGQGDTTRKEEEP